MKVVDVDIRPAVAQFATLMEAKLRQRDDRPGWKGQSVDWLLGRLCDEVDELRMALLLVDRPEPEQSPRETFERLALASAADECADVANFAMMIADVLGELGDTGDRGRGDG